MRHAAFLCISLASLGALAGCGDNLTHPPDRDPFGEGDAGPLSCVPNLDGRVDAAELKATLGVPVTYLVSPEGEEREVDVAGVNDGDGGKIWDFSADYASDKIATLTAVDVTDQWFASSFPGGQFATALDAAGTIQGIYAADDDAISLLGVASTKEKPKEGKTLLVYSAPVQIYRFPLKPGAKWVSAGEITGGTLRGLPYAGKDIYEVEDDATGELELHDFTFTQAHRIRTKVTVEPAAGASTFQRQVGFVFECFGEVARATSKNDEPEENFTKAAEVRRLGK